VVLKAQDHADGEEQGEGEQKDDEPLAENTASQTTACVVDGQTPVSRFTPGPLGKRSWAGVVFPDQRRCCGVIHY
jgi:hypothetical protein